MNGLPGRFLDSRYSPRYAHNEPVMRIFLRSITTMFTRRLCTRNLGLALFLLAGLSGVLPASAQLGET